MGAEEAITTALNSFFTMFDVPVYPEDSVPPGSSLPYITVKLVIPKGFDESSTFHARLWYPVDGGKLPLIRKADEIRAAIDDWLTMSARAAQFFCVRAIRGRSLWATRRKNTCAHTLFLTSHPLWCEKG